MDYVKTILILSTIMSLVRMGYYSAKEEGFGLFVNAINTICYSVAVYFIFNI